jgi:hypothetical protein
MQGISQRNEGYRQLGTPSPISQSRKSTASPQGGAKSKRLSPLSIQTIGSIFECDVIPHVDSKFIESLPKIIESEPGIISFSDNAGGTIRYIRTQEEVGKGASNATLVKYKKQGGEESTLPKEIVVKRFEYKDDTDGRREAKVHLLAFKKHFPSPVVISGAELWVISPFYSKVQKGVEDRLSIGNVKSLIGDYAQSCVDNELLHNDIKPANLVIDDEGNLKLIDFGIASKCSEEALLIGSKQWYVPSEKTSMERDLFQIALSVLAIFLKKTDEGGNYYSSLFNPQEGGGIAPFWQLLDNVNGRKQEEDNNRSSFQEEITDVINKLTCGSEEDKDELKKFLTAALWMDQGTRKVALKNNSWTKPLYDMVNKTNAVKIQSIIRGQQVRLKLITA